MGNLTKLHRQLQKSEGLARITLWIGHLKSAQEMLQKTLTEEAGLKEYNEVHVPSFTKLYLYLANELFSLFSEEIEIGEQFLAALLKQVKRKTG